jgi:hypothetical protein
MSYESNLRSRSARCRRRTILHPDNHETSRRHRFIIGHLFATFLRAFPEGPLAKKSGAGTAQDIFVLDSALVLIEGQPYVMII